MPTTNDQWGSSSTRCTITIQQSTLPWPSNCCICCVCVAVYCSSVAPYSLTRARIGYLPTAASTTSQFSAPFQTFLTTHDKTSIDCMEYFSLVVARVANVIDTQSSDNWCKATHANHTFREFTSDSHVCASGATAAALRCSLTRAMCVVACCSTYQQELAISVLELLLLPISTSRLVTLLLVCGRTTTNQPSWQQRSALSLSLSRSLTCTSSTGPHFGLSQLALCNNQRCWIACSIVTGCYQTACNRSVCTPAQPTSPSKQAVD
jgi:hypothetical protein